MRDGKPSTWTGTQERNPGFPSPMWVPTSPTPAAQVGDRKEEARLLCKEPREPTGRSVTLKGPSQRGSGHSWCSHHSELSPLEPNRGSSGTSTWPRGTGKGSGT